MKLTKEEENIILKRRKREKPQQPDKTGILRCDLYSALAFYLDSDFFDAKEMASEVKTFESSFDVMYKAGTRFNHYPNVYTNGAWFEETDIDLDEPVNDEIEHYLKRITEVK